jgi:hypothetical protein
LGASTLIQLLSKMLKLSQKNNFKENENDEGKY